MIILLNGYDLFNNEDEFSDEEYAPTPREDGSKRSKREATVEALLTAKTKAELVAFLLDVLPRHPKLIDELKNAEQIKTATPEKLITKLQRDIKKNHCARKPGTTTGAIAVSCPTTRRF